MLNKLLDSFTLDNKYRWLAIWFVGFGIYSLKMGDTDLAMLSTNIAIVFAILETAKESKKDGE